MTNLQIYHLNNIGETKSPYLKRYFYVKKIEKIWLMKNGFKIRICDMYDHHLLNTIKMLEKIAEQLDDPDDPFSYRNINEVYPSYKYLIKEKKYRGLK